MIAWCCVKNIDDDDCNDDIVVVVFNAEDYDYDTFEIQTFCQTTVLYKPNNF